MGISFMGSKTKDNADVLTTANSEIFVELQSLGWRKGRNRFLAKFCKIGRLKLRPGTQMANSSDCFGDRHRSLLIEYCTVFILKCIYCSPVYFARTDAEICLHLFSGVHGSPFRCGRAKWLDALQILQCVRVVEMGWAKSWLWNSLRVVLQEISLLVQERVCVCSPFCWVTCTSLGVFSCFLITALFFFFLCILNQ